MLKISKFITLSIFVSAILVGSIIFAGSINITSAPESTSYTLSDIYNLIHNNSTTTEASHNIYPNTDTGTPTMYSISELYVELSNLIDQTKLSSSSVTYLGVTGGVDPTEVSAITKDFDPITQAGTVIGFTLDDIYNLITNNTRPLTPDHPYTPSSEPAGTQHTLTDIYNKLAGIPDPFILPETIATGTIYLGVTGTYVRPPEEIATINLNAAFPNTGVSTCPSSDFVRSTTTGPYPFDVIVKAKTALSADDYLKINDLVVPVTGTNSYCGAPRLSGTNVSIDTEIMTVEADTLITIYNIDTVGVASSASGTISIMRIY